MEATDRGNPSRIGTADIFIDVININDNNPRFDRSFYVAEVSEGLFITCIVIGILTVHMSIIVIGYTMVAYSTLFHSLCTIDSAFRVVAWS